MADFREVIEGAQGGFEKLVGGIPGYKGYKEKEWRREADKLLREKLVRELETYHRQLTDLQMELVNIALIEYTDDLDRALRKLQHLIDRIKTAIYGYSGFFDAVKVKEEQLDAIYAYDAGLLEQVPALGTLVDALRGAVEAGEGIAPAIKELITATAQLNELFEKREEAIYGVLPRIETPKPSMEESGE